MESLKIFLIEYPKKKNFPASVYQASYGLVEYATNQFEENTKQIEELIRQREKNITMAGEIKDILEIVEDKEKDWKEKLKEASDRLPEDIVETLSVIGRCRVKNSENYQNAVKIVNARIVNLETNLHIEIDMERIEDRSKALSYIGIEVAEALKAIPTPVDTEVEEQAVEQPMAETTEEDEYIKQTTFEVKPSLWQRIKNSKVVKAISYIMKIKVVVEVPNALPEGRGEEQK